MTTFTREQIKRLRNDFECWQQDYDPIADREQYKMFGDGMAAIDMLLAALQQEQQKAAGAAENCRSSENVQVTPDFDTWFYSPERGLTSINIGVQRELQLAAWNSCRAAMLQAGNSPVTPDGWVMVPKEITCAMDDAAWEAYHETRCMSDIWAALLASAPQQEVKSALEHGMQRYVGAMQKLSEGDK